MCVRERERERGSVCNINSIEITIHRNKRVCAAGTSGRGRSRRTVKFFWSVSALSLLYLFIYLSCFIIQPQEHEMTKTWKYDKDSQTSQKQHASSAIEQ